MKLSDFNLLTFDTYGTLIDWESGIYNALEPLLDKVPIKLGRDEVLELFAEFEMQQQAARPSTSGVRSSTGRRSTIPPRL